MENLGREERFGQLYLAIVRSSVNCTEMKLSIVSSKKRCSNLIGHSSGLEIVSFVGSLWLQVYPEMLRAL